MIKLIGSTFYNERETKTRLAAFIQQSTSLSMNSECRLFETNFARKQGRKHAIFVSSGSSANLVLIQALLNLGRLQKGDRVGFSALTWSTNVMPLIQLGLEPVAFDCELDTLNTSPEILQKDHKGIKAFFLTNVLGFADDLEKFQKYCKEQNILLLEDNCESLGSQIGATLLGNFSLGSTFSFFVGHHMSTIEGGMITTNDHELYEACLMTRAHGWDRNLSAETQSKLRSESSISDFYGKYTFYDLGYNTRPTEINGFLGNSQLEHWHDIITKRENNFKKFHAAAKNNPELHTFNLDHMNVISNFAFPVITKVKSYHEKYVQRFIDAEVEVRPVIAGNITQQPFFKKYSKESFSCPNSQLVHEQGLYFPNHPELTEAEVDLLCSLLRN